MAIGRIAWCVVFVMANAAVWATIIKTGASRHPADVAALGCACSPLGIPFTPPEDREELWAATR